MSHLNLDGKRGSGRTTQQMQRAPKGAIYIWCNSHLDYPKRLASQLGRQDLVLVRPDWLSDRRYMGQRLSGIIIDHATTLSEEQLALYPSAVMRVFVQ
jgi:hypothetical protein